jgi:hypothetical protein
VGLSSSLVGHSQQSQGGIAAASVEMERKMAPSSIFNVAPAQYTAESTHMIDRFGNTSSGSIGLAMPQQSQLDTTGTTYYSRPVYQSQTTIITPATVHGRPSPPSPTVVIVSPQASPLTGYGVPLGSFNDDFSMFTDPLYFGGQGTAADMGGLGGGGGVSYLMGYGPTSGFSGDEYAAAEATYARVFSPPSPSLSGSVPGNFNTFGQFSSAPAENSVEAMNKKRNTMSRSISKNLRNSENLSK